jgi:N-acetylglucosamine-6-sulfatase
MVPLLRGESPEWRDYFLYVYYWERNFPQSPTVFALRGDRYKFISYYGLWDTDELYDLEADPDEMHNLRHDPEYTELAEQMQDQLYTMMEEMGGMDIPLNPPSGNFQNKRYRSRGGEEAADFPGAMVLDEPVNTNAR